MGIESGFLFANPISHKFSIPKAKIDLAISQAVAEAEAKGIHGHANTPFILDRIKDLTAGTSVAANKSLVSANVELAAMIAKNLSRLRKVQGGPETAYTYRLPLNTTAAKGDSNPVLGTSKAAIDTNGDSQVHTPIVSSSIPNPQNLQTNEQNPLLDPAILVVGSVAMDLACDAAPLTPSSSNTEVAATFQFHTSNPATIANSIGGVGHNVALAAQYTSKGNSVLVCSFVGDDLWVFLLKNILVALPNLTQLPTQT